MQWRFSRSTVAAILLAATVTTPLACPIADCATLLDLQTEGPDDPETTSALPHDDELASSLTSDTATDVAFALDDWVILLDHEGESFTAVLKPAAPDATRQRSLRDSGPRGDRWPL